MAIVNNMEEKLKLINEYIIRKEQDAAQRITVNADYFQAVLSTLSELKDFIRTI